MDQLDQRCTSSMEHAVSITVKGRVQGVGFRPFIFSLAKHYQIMGTVQNNMDGVKIHAEASTLALLQSFYVDIEKHTPRMAKINATSIVETPCKGFEDFSIIPSDPKGNSALVIPIDAAVCEDCKQEMYDDENFRFEYPFINCTQCGPRYTIISELPYDRTNTSMADFEMCPNCQSEYEDPLNRRHHAQPIACPSCGPRIRLYSVDGVEVNLSGVDTVRQLLKSGHIVAIKGIGGYHLCCDATNENAVSNLRNRKNRPSRPLAIMAKSVNTIEVIADLSPAEITTLTGPEAPIVLLKKKPNKRLSSNVAPGMSTVGIMLPYTGLHHLLLDEQELPYMVATSANPSGFPILYEDDKAFVYLNGIADYILMNDRPILHPIDDSVVQVLEDHDDIIRRSRGYAPDPYTSLTNVNGIVAFGGQMKNTFAIGREYQMIIGPHIGDISHLEMEDHFKRELNHLLKWTNVPKQVAVIDLHPHFSTREIAMEYDFESIIEVQHHHAHMAGCMEENGLDEECFAIVLDGTGYGSDGNIWGFEIFRGTKSHYNRLGHLRYTALPGGDKAVMEGWRNTTGMLITLLGETGLNNAVRLFPDRKEQIAILNQLIQHKINMPLAGTCGRLFDSVSAILGICESGTYDGEAAVKLSELAIPFEKNSYKYSWECVDGLDELDVGPMLTTIIEEKFNNRPVEEIAGQFQWTIVVALVDMLKKFSVSYPEIDKNIVLSGGSFHNRYLINTLEKELTNAGFRVYVPRSVPAGDGGLSYGQLAVAAAKRRNMECV